MSAVRNSAFADAGSMPGQAQGWTLQTHCQRERIAAFGSTPPLAWEGFERWTPLLLRLEDVSVARAFASGPEAFHEGWGVEPYLMELSPGALEELDTEDYEAAWSNDDFAWAWADVQAAPAPTETFEVEWRSNEAFARAWADVLAAAIAFTEDPHVGPTGIELFESYWSAARSI